MSYEYFYLYKKSNIEETAGIPSSDMKLYIDDDYEFDAFLNILGCYRTDSKIHFYSPKKSADVWDIFSQLKKHLENKYNKNEWFVHTSAPGSCIIQLTSLTQNK
jgi:hypothetical protein